MSAVWFSGTILSSASYAAMPLLVSGRATRVTMNPDDFADIVGLELWVW